MNICFQSVIVLDLELVFTGEAKLFWASLVRCGISRPKTKTKTKQNKTRMSQMIHFCILAHWDVFIFNTLYKLHNSPKQGQGEQNALKLQRNIDGLSLLLYNTRAVLVDNIVFYNVSLLLYWFSLYMCIIFTTYWMLVWHTKFWIMEI